jgi:hypothetical protein
MVMEMKKEKAEKKERKNNYGFKAAGFTMLIVAFCIGIFFLANMLTPFQGLEDREDMRVIMESYMYIDMVLSTIMLIISFYLIYTYLKDYLELKSSFTFGVLLAVISFMLFAISANPILHMLFGVFGRPGLFSIIPPLFATVSLAMLAWVSSK